jgi:sigma-54 dependent transcriptional regulator, acetoin dehydrogenase operon transcriptional activator AcoR
MYLRTVAEESATPGLVVRVRSGRAASPQRTTRPAAARMPLPGLVGSAPAWLRACDELERAFRAGEWLAVEGEPGVGKLALLSAVQLRRQPVRRFSVHDAADATRTADWAAELKAALEGGGSVVVRHVDRLTTARLRILESLLGEASGASEAWVAVTLEGSSQRSATLQRVLALFPGTLEVPPLRLHLDDLEVLVPLLLARLGQRRLVCSPEAMRLLMRLSWPGNVAQVHETLRKVVSHRRTGVIRPEDLPPEVHSLTRRLLTPLESLERDAIVTALADAAGNKVQAAKALGMSRATIYRKIYDYRIVTSAEG